MKSAKTYLILLIGIAALNVEGQIYFKNNNTESVIVAFARYTSNGRTGSWQTKGWWTVKSGSTIIAYEKTGPADSIGYWCMTTLSNDTFEGSRRLLVHPDEKFTIINADDDNDGKIDPAWVWYNFRMVRLQDGNFQGTITFKN